MAFWRSCCSCIPQRWITILLCFFGLLNAYSMRICLSIAITEMVVPLNETVELADDTCPNGEEITVVSANEPAVHRELYHWSEYTQGVILSSFYWAYIISNFLGGEIAKKFGGKHILGFGILTTAILTILTPATVKWGGSAALIWLRVLMGFGEGVTYPALSALMAQWIPQHERSKAGSIVFSGGSLGTVFGMTMAGIILKQPDLGWPAVFYFFGGVGCLCFALNCAFCYNNPSENPFISEEEAKYLKENLKNTNDHLLPATPWGKILRSKPVWALVAITIGNGWGFLTMVSDMPKYMSSVLRFSVESNGYLSSLPYLALWVVSSITSVIADSFLASGRMTVQQVRKTGATIASMGPAIFLIAASYAGCDRVLVVVLFTAGLAMMGCCTFSIFINQLDLGPNYAGSLMGLVNGIATLTGVLSPYIVGMLTPNQTLSEWRLVFWGVFIVFAVTNSIYLMWGSAQLQEWNDPAFLMGKKKTHHHHAKENIQLLTNK